MNKNLPQRKHTRLKDYDYSSSGAYFITICTENKQCVLSHIVGRGLAPADAPKIEYTSFGQIAEEQLSALKMRFSYISIDSYVIMPNHIHFMLILNDSAGASPRPTVMDIVCAYKSLTTVQCKKNGFIGKLFQDSFYEHIIRGQNDYDEITNYIVNNPAKWHDDSLYVEE